MTGIEFHLACMFVALVSLHLGWSEYRSVRRAGEVARAALGRRHARLAREADVEAGRLAGQALPSLFGGVK